MVCLPEHYQRPGWFTTNVFNRLVAALTRVGVSVYGSRVLEVKGRKSGQWRQTPVNLLRYVDADYLVSPKSACSSPGSGPSHRTRNCAGSRRTIRSSG
jgi:hypothetical protein